MKHRDCCPAFQIVLFAGIFCGLWTPALDAQQTPIQTESLEEIAARDPSEEVQLRVDFHSIQREPQIVAMLDNSRVLLDEIKFKFVGSGGGSTGPYSELNRTERMSIREIFNEAELQHRLFFQLLVSEGREIPTVDCPVADEAAPTSDTHGVPGEPAVELACGLRIVEMTVSGAAAEALSFAEQNRDVALFIKAPSARERRQLLEIMKQQRCQRSGGRECER